MRVFQLVLNAMDTTGILNRVKLVALSGDGKFKEIKSASTQKRLLMLSSASKARVPAGFLFDSGGRTDQEKSDLKKSLDDSPKSGVCFLVRPELEDYLLEPNSVTTILNKERKILEMPQDAELQVKVNEIIQCGAPKGSSVLEKCYVVGLKRNYRKKIDSAALASEILASRPEFLVPLFNELLEFANSLGH